LWLPDEHVVTNPGATILVKGSGFPPGVEVALYIRETGWTKVKTNVSGAFEVLAVVPILPPGVYTIRALVGGVLWATHPLNIKGVPPPQDASIKFLTWTINGIPVPPGKYTVMQSTIIDALYVQHVAGEPDKLVHLKERSEISIHYVKGEPAAIRWHVVNHPNAVNKDPMAKKKYQYATLDGKRVEQSTYFRTHKSMPRLLDVETAWQLKKSTTYTKRINWLHIGEVTEEEVLFDLLPPNEGIIQLISVAEVELEPPDIDVDLTNNRAKSPILELEIVPAVHKPTKITLHPEKAENPVCTTHKVTAMVTCVDGRPVVGAEVTFVVEGANPTKWSGKTDSAGMITFAYHGPKEGEDMISAHVDGLVARAIKWWFIKR